MPDCPGSKQFLQLSTRTGLATMSLSVVILVGTLDKTCDAQPPELKGNRTSKKYWEAIMASGPNATLAADERFREQLGDYWAAVAFDAGNTFNEMMKDPEWRKHVTYFVEQFGKHGAGADIRWLLAEPGMTMSGWSGDKVGLYTGEDSREKHWREVQVFLSRLHVARMLESEAEFRRYYRVTVWEGVLYRRLTFPHMCLSLKRHFKRDSDGYWWYARIFLMLAHATGRDDLLTDTEPDQLHEKFASWIEWLARNGAYLRPLPDSSRWYLAPGEKMRDEAYAPFLKKGRLPRLRNRPHQPFPDWDGPPIDTESFTAFR